MPAELIFELGTEEIPAGFLARAVDELDRLARERLAGARLGFENLSVLGTPRRIALLVSGLADRQPDLSERVVGPPVTAAFDKDGKPTKAAIGFAAKNGVAVDALEKSEVEGKKGVYVVCTRREAGAPAFQVLPALLGALVDAIPWPKSMRWGGGDAAFVRPVHWLVAVLSGEVLPLTWHGLRAGRLSRGHRFLAPAEVDVGTSGADYVAALRRAFVLVDQQTRGETIEAELRRIETETGWTVRPDPRLLEEVTNLVEYPVGVCGEFDRRFLDVPEEVVVSAMRAHQRYFAMQDGDGRLVNRFVTIAGTVTRDVAVVRHGNERVLAARLADARFFWEEDKKKGLEHFAAKLDGVVFQAKLGTVGAKVGRIRYIAARLAERIGLDAGAVDRVAKLCKADLTTHMVGEFPDLQGVMGMYYALKSDPPEPPEVAAGIAEHYRPRGATDRMPASELGAAVGIADRIDTLVGCFAVGLQPSGSADPYGLRRAALGILQILLDRNWSIDPIDFVAGELAGIPLQPAKDMVREFLEVRLRGLLVESHGIAADCVDAALAIESADVPRAKARAEAVALLRTRPDFEPLAIAFKRVANILKDQPTGGAPDRGSFRHEAERNLWSAYEQIRDDIESKLASGDYRAAMLRLAELKEPVDRFFDAVMVMDEDPAVRKNRLALLGRINATFTRIADFRQLAVG